MNRGSNIRMGRTPDRKPPDRLQKRTGPLKKKNKHVFRWAYVVFLCVLVFFMVWALIHVNSVLKMYETEHPQRQLDRAVELLKTEAKSGELWSKPGVPSMESSSFEPDSSPKKDFISKLDGNLKFTSQNWINENECVYGVISGDITIAEITLRKNGPPVKKLGIINIQKYELASYVPVDHTYTLEIPEDVVLNSEITVSVNGIALSADSGAANESGRTVFTLAGLYSKPEIVITDSQGNKANCRLPSSKNGKIEFENTLYTLTLPPELSVTVDGEKTNQTALNGDGRYVYKIRLAKKAEVCISDLFGNTVSYSGSSSVPITYYTFTLGDGCAVSVEGKSVPDQAVTETVNPEFKNFADLAPGLPTFKTYRIVVLKNNADISIKDSAGNDIPYDKENRIQDLADKTLGVSSTSVPDYIAAEINVLKALEDWSLYMSCDLNFQSITKYLIKSSYQYDVAYKYSYSIDRTFTSNHTLMNPPFVDENVSNFVKLTDNCFSVDIRFTKRMVVLGNQLDDSMNERCYFVKYDDTNDGVNNPKWKLVGMKEIVKNG